MGTDPVCGMALNPGAPHPVDKMQVVDRLPPSVRAGHDNFFTCERGRRIYWRGSHWQRMRALLAGAGVGSAGGLDR